MRRFLPLFALCAAVMWATALVASTAEATTVAASEKPVTLAVQAVVAQGARKPVAGPVMWSVVRLMDDKNPGAVVASATEASPKFSLPPGHYLVTAKLGQAEGKQPVELTSAPVKMIVNLNAGVLRVNLIPYAGAKPVTDPVHWELLTYARDAGAQTRVTEADAAATEFILPAGSYVLRAAYQGTHAELVVPLEAGQTFNYTLNLYAGKARATAVSEKGAAFKDPVTWEVVRAADRSLVSADTTPAPQFTLREGRYVMLARQGNHAGEAPFEVKAGKSSSVKVTLKSLPPEQIAALEKASNERKAQAAAALAPKAAAPAATVAAAPAASSAPAAAAGP
ncbi:MAG: hypothetical protein IRY94_14705, partial [Rhodospirillaceae bacterium]|nr:hypothetical protein [Rhodospirillaceae bacterium]